ncbi:MAG: hypothetical protein CSA95_06135 [Bacteroidetes bacterium]|nr:MAG: hypothetical protein CSA95_06135 [Bacteroidota bacterium]PIE87552.1 MAG: hypothetical protein CSA04_06180 [Bacteroidota bacterium]
MDKIYTQHNSYFPVSEKFDESLMDMIPEDIVPDDRLVEAILAYDKALSFVRTQTVTTASLILN